MVMLMNKYDRPVVCGFVASLRLMAVWAALATVVGAGAGCASTGEDSNSREHHAAIRAHHGKLVIVGGGLRENNSDVYREFVVAAMAERVREIQARPKPDHRANVLYSDRSSNTVSGIGSGERVAVDDGSDPWGKYRYERPRVEWLRIAIVPTSSGDPEGAARSASAAIRRAAMHADLKIETAMLRVDLPESADDAVIAAIIDGAHGVWFTGGDQSRVTRALRLNEGGIGGGGGSSGLSLDDRLGGTAVGAALARARARGAAIGGTSAGAAIMSDPMLAGGTSDRWLRSLWDAVDAGGDAYSAVESGAVRLVPGVGFFEHALTDQHFLARGRLGRLVVATLADPRGVGIGIADDRAATVIKKGSSDVDVVRPIGAESVVLVDTRRAVVSAEGVRGVRVSLLGDGDSVEFHRGKHLPVAVKLSGAKGFKVGRAVGDYTPMPWSADVYGMPAVSGEPVIKVEHREEKAWESGAVLLAIRRLAMTNRSQVLESDSARITLSSDHLTRFRFGGGWMYAASDVVLDIEAIRGGPIADEDDGDDENNDR